MRQVAYSILRWLAYIGGGTILGLLGAFLLGAVVLRIVEGPDPGEFVGPGFGLMLLVLFGAVAGSVVGMILAARHQESIDARKKL